MKSQCQCSTCVLFSAINETRINRTHVSVCESSAKTASFKGNAFEKRTGSIQCRSLAEYRTVHGERKKERKKGDAKPAFCWLELSFPQVQLRRQRSLELPGCV
mmetsp:Transcript_15796/g.26054  ORF Transcript_15796/g.26054 Transcript_15796/m.26054 type:complete len:103 (-) Transcript_15796:72-380(-)